MGTTEESPLSGTGSNSSSARQDENIDVEATAGKEKAQAATDLPEFAVDWTEGDVENPKNWSARRQWSIVVFLSWITLLT